MYTFKTGTGKRRQKQVQRLLCVIIFILLIALAGVTYSYVRSRSAGANTSEAILSRVFSEAANAQSTVYRLTQSSGTNTMTLLSTVRSHISVLQAINAIAANIYGAGTSIVDGELLTACIDTIGQCETRMQAGSVLTTAFTTLRDQVDAVVAAFAGTI